MKRKGKKIIILFVFIVILLSPIITINFISFALGGLSPSKVGYMQIHEKNNNYTYFKNYETNYVSIDNLPPYVSSYIVGLEDQNFYKHNGYDIKRIFASLFNNFKSGEIVSGGSTITQQLARILYLNNEKNYSRKFKEIIYAKRLEAGLTKKQILELYLNEVYFGDNLYGINAAANSYFHKDAKDLTENETLLLFSLLPAPNSYSPRVNIELSKEVYFKAAKNLYYRNVINEDTFYNLTNYFPSYDEVNQITHNTSWYNQSIYENLTKGNILVDKNRISVSSSVDPYVQNVLEDIVSCVSFEEKTNIGVVVMQPETGNVLGIMGGKSVDGFNRVLSSSKAIGSTVKPILYTIALEEGFTPSSSFISEPESFYLGDDIVFAPQNNNELYAYRKVNMVEALALSDNIYATKLALVLGTDHLTNRLSAINIKIENNITNALGSFSLSLMELTSIYNALANNGIYHSPRFYNEYSINGKTYSIGSKSRRLFDEEKARIMSYMLLSTQDKALKTYATPTMLYNQTSKRFGVKTGSTDSSSFVIGYNPMYTIGVYVGTDDNSKLYQTNISKIVFRLIADKLMEHKKDVYFSTDDLEPFVLYNSKTETKSFTYYK